MHSFNAYLKDLTRSTGIDFSVVGDDDTVYYDTSASLNDNANTIVFYANIGSQKVKVTLDKKFESSASLLRFCIESRYVQLFSMREQYLMDILDRKEYNVDEIKKVFPLLPKPYTIFLVRVGGSRNEAISIIKHLYSEEEATVLAYEENILVVGCFEDIREHAESIKDSIVSELYCRCNISYSMPSTSVEGIIEAYKQVKEAITVGMAFNISGEIYDYSKLMFEKIVYNLNEDGKTELLNLFADKFNTFDSEMINTIEEFVNSGLNISDASKVLYIHRNTLIYRLDKIHKDTGYDIRDFKQAAVFIIAFLVWKARNN